jgi:hypothetical protein
LGVRDGAAFCAEDGSPFCKIVFSGSFTADLLLSANLVAGH